MDFFVNISSYFMYFCAGLSILMALELATRGGLNKLNRILIALLTGNMLLLSGISSLGNRIIFEYPIMAFPVLSVLFYIGPIDYIYFYSVTDDSRIKSRRFLLHFIPPAFFLIFEICLHLFYSHNFKVALFQTLVNSPGDSIYLTSLVSIGVMIIAAYLVYLLKAIRIFWNRDTFKTEINFIILWNIFALISTFSLYIGFLFGIRILYVMGGVILGFLTLIIFFARVRHGQFFDNLRSDIKQKKYERSLLKGVNVEVIQIRLKELMEEEFLYRDYELNLKTLAEFLSISHHQLSQFINETLNVDFRNYINQYRINEACRLLCDKPELTVLRIGFEVGFQSKSAFNDAFKKFTGLSPQVYRKKNKELSVKKSK